MAPAMIAGLGSLAAVPFYVGAAFVLAGESLDFGLEDAPFDPGGSWLLGDARSQARALACAACLVFAAIRCPNSRELAVKAGQSQNDTHT